MPNPISLILQPKQGLSQKQTQRLIMSEHMQQALNLLQMPVHELAAIVEAEIEQNPVLEYAPEEYEEESEELNLNDEERVEKSLQFSDQDYELIYRLDRDFRDLFAESRNHSMLKCADQDQKGRDYKESLIVQRVSLFEHLMNQAHDTFDDAKDLELAEMLIGNLDESGFLTTPLTEIVVLQHVLKKDLVRVLTEIQTFEPYGVGAKNLKECLLIQLCCQGRQDSLAYRVIDEQYDNLLHNKLPEIQKKLKCSKIELNRAVYTEIAKLDFHPGSSFSQDDASPIIPDISIEERGEELVVVSNDEDYLPNIRLNPEYLKMLEGQVNSSETKDFVKQKVLSAKWLLRNIAHRGTTLQRIAYSLLKRQKEFFASPEGKLVPLTMLTLAEELELHESTIARAVANKYISTPRGLFPLRFFFTNALGAENGEVSSNTVRDYMVEIINGEDKKHPLSDNEITKRLNEKGIECSRRTVAKYRGLLKIGNAHQRKQY